MAGDSPPTCPECGRETKATDMGRFCPNCYWTEGQETNDD